MFVGGVSSRGESAKLTAAREVAEELGLKRALECLEGKCTTENNPLSDELFQCAICTSYNRCIVSMFAYTCNTEAESISWQEEEVAWGDFVPYDVVKVAGRLSINRLIDKGTWPGTVIKFESASEAMTEQTDESEQDYSSWDFVPDGLLVWEAWVRWFADKN
jgi:8-oxo-dGTP pyrophosphatase MutT (NUDIX family)